MDPRYYGPPPVAPGADIPPSAPEHSSPLPARTRGGFMGWLITAAAVIAGYAGKAALLFKLLLGASKAGTILSALVSFGAFSIVRGPVFAAGLIAMLFVHEMGHVYEIRRQGMKASAPIFIPFLGAAIFQRSHPTNALKQAQIGIAGPIAGTLGAVVAFALYGVTREPILLTAAWIGVYLNLFNLIPAGFLDGGWILGAVHRYFQIFGLLLLALGILFLGFSPIFIGLLLLLSWQVIVDRFRNDRLPYYQVPVRSRLAMGGAWLGLVLFLGYMLVEVQNQLLPILG